MFHVRKCLAMLCAIGAGGFCWLAARFSYATAALLLVDLLAWDSEGKIVRNYLQQDEAPTADE
ncbi:hypothetical protein D9M68_452460 [compost metagenome]